MTRIAVCGYMVRFPLAGMIMVYFHYLLGLHRLGHELVYVEESGWPTSCFDPVRNEHVDDPSAGLRIVRKLMEYYGVDIPLCYVDRESGDTWGMDRAEMRRSISTADVLLNVGGVCWLPDFLLCQHRALVDLDPFFTQIGRFAVEGLDEYQAYFTYGANIGRPGCSIPTNGRTWLATVPPVVPEIWAVEQSAAETSGNAAFTTVANWTAYGTVDYQGVRYGQKDQEFLALGDLPCRTGQKLELALANADPDAVRMLGRSGWSIVDAAGISKDIATYRSYIAESRGEFTVAKNAYVRTHSGWFSDRSVCYLATGRPVIMQDTGFSGWLPTGEGVLAFSTADEALACIEQVNSRYSANCRAARALAEERFSYKVVLPAMLDSIREM
jgi:hypothetical protein